MLFLKVVNDSINTTPIKHIEKTPELIVTKIAKYSKEYKFDLGTALRIADCESEFGTNTINKYSTAKGVYQFTYGTWNHYCKGNVINEDDNIKCFMELYPKHKDWWECK